MCAAAHAQVGTHACPSPLLAAPLFLQQMADMLISEEAKESPPSLFLTYASAASDGQSGLSRTETRPRSRLCCQSCGFRLGIHGNQRRQLITESFSSSCPLFLLFSFTTEERFVSGAPCLTTHAFFSGNTSESIKCVNAARPISSSHRGGAI